MRIGAAPYFPQQTAYQGVQSQAVPTGNEQQGSSASAALDFTSMSRSGLRDTVNSLIASGKLSLDDASGLVGLIAGPDDSLRAICSTDRREVRPATSPGA